ncbi:MAG: hypothetical protein CR972_00390 [Candidatus Moraniibacteriota bacterium]|nr:MAG: hypothetical protein CR972_00390 [Candidatus Moranbacteria bacterium]
MSEKMTKKQRTVLATYPIAIFVFFAFLVGMSMYVHYSYENPEKLIIDHQIEEGENSKKKEKQIKEVFSKKNDIITRPVFQPVKKEGFQDLFIESAHSAIVFDADSGTILWEKNATEKRSIASITKLVTSMIVIDRMQDIDEIVTIPGEIISIEGTTVGCPTSVICNSPRFFPGERVRLRDLLRSALIFSANDAATVLGLHVAGSEEAFAKLMNARMKELGAGNTHFCRPSGLELDENEESCYSSAYDIARVMAHLHQHEKYDVLWEIMRTKEMTFADVDNTVVHELKNTNRLIEKMDNLAGAKTGFTPRAGYCLALAAEDHTKEHTVISIVLDDYNRFADVEEMTTWAFDNYEWK